MLISARQILFGKKANDFALFSFNGVKFCKFLRMERVVPLKIPDFIECHFAIQSAGDNFGKRHKVDVRGIAIFARKIRHFLDIYFILVKTWFTF